MRCAGGELRQRFELDPTKRGRQYSKGNRPKVAIVAALASDVELLIFDEPTRGLDPLMENVFQEVVKEAKQQVTLVAWFGVLISFVLTILGPDVSPVGLVPRHQPVQARAQPG